MLKQVQHQLNKIESLLTSIKNNEVEFMDLEEASQFLKLKKPTIYQMVFKREIPFYKSTKKLLFKKNELVEWVENSKVLTLKELETRSNVLIN
jgi:excisionase family DNA binding protein